MRFVFTVDSDIGIAKNTNQDSILVRHARYSESEVLMSIICDGMGGLSKGELASATVIRTFNEWFDKELLYELDNLDLQVIGGKWSLMLKDLNVKILEYAQKNKINMGTTFTGILFVEGQYVIVHVGDTRIYEIGSNLQQLTTDHTYVARELKRGRMTLEQAKVDKRRNMLLQCVGASITLEPEISIGNQLKGIYMLCSDGLRHEISNEEMYESLNPRNLVDKQAMHSSAKYLIELAKQRNERDNISVILIRVD